MRRFVRPDITRLPLSDGDWIDIKHELNVGEQRRIFARMVKDMTVGGVNTKTTLDPEAVGRAKVAEYLVAWSFVDDNGKPVPVSASTLDSLSTETFREVSEAIETHEAAIEQLHEQEKNERPAVTGAAEPSAILSSVG